MKWTYRVFIYIYGLYLTDATGTEYLGCFENDPGKPILTGIYFFSLINSVTNCVIACNFKNYMYAGVENKLWCYCGFDNVTGIILDDSNCDATCPVNWEQDCGGVRKIAIYRISNESITEPTATDLTMSTSTQMTSDLTISTSQDTSSQQSVPTTVSNNIIESKSTTSSTETVTMTTTDLPTTESSSGSTETDTTNPDTIVNCCHCYYVNVSGEQLVNIDELISTLTIEKKITSSYRRSLTCAPDSRLSSLVMGWVGILSISIPFLLLLIVDLVNCFMRKPECDLAEDSAK